MTAICVMNKWVKWISKTIKRDTIAPNVAKLYARIAAKTNGSFQRQIASFTKYVTCAITFFPIIFLKRTSSLILRGSTKLVKIWPRESNLLIKNYKISTKSKENKRNSFKNAKKKYNSKRCDTSIKSKSKDRKTTKSTKKTTKQKPAFTKLKT